MTQFYSQTVPDNGMGGPVQNIGPSTAPAPKVPEIQMVVSEQETRLAALHDDISALEKALHPILREEPKGDLPLGTPISIHTELGSKMNSIANGIFEASLRLRSIMLRLEL